jgi:hypothetical protein
MFEMPGGTPLAEVKWEDTNFSDVGSGPRLSSNPSLVDVSLCLIEDEGVDGCPESPAKVVIFNAQRNHTIAAGKRLLSGKSGKVEEADQIFAPLTNQFFGRGGGIDQPFTFVASCDDATDDAPPERLSLCKVEVEFPEAELSGRLIVRRLGSQYMLEAAKEIASMLDHWERRGG